MYQVFNMGIGLVIVIAPEEVAKALAVLPEAVAIGQAISLVGNESPIQIF